MTCCASLLLLLAVGTPHDSVPASFAARVRSEVATRWSVEPAAVQVAWETPPVDSLLGEGTPFHLSGRGNDGWLVVVVEPPHAAPHAFRIRAGVICRVPVATRALHQGQRLVASDYVEHDEVVWSALAVNVITTLTGWELRRDVAAGAILAGNTVAAPKVIAAGETIRFVWADRGIRIEREAVALSPARLGEKVQGMAGSIRLSGVATGPGTAQLKGGAR